MGYTTNGDIDTNSLLLARGVGGFGYGHYGYHGHELDRQFDAKEIKDGISEARTQARDFHLENDLDSKFTNQTTAFTAGIKGLADETKFASILSGIGDISRDSAVANAKADMNKELILQGQASIKDLVKCENESVRALVLATSGKTDALVASSAAVADKAAEVNALKAQVFALQNG